MLSDERLSNIRQDVELEAEGIEPGYWTDTVYELLAEVARLRTELEAARTALEARTRYLHCEIHVDHEHNPVGSWTECQRPTCTDSRAALSGASAAGGAGEDATPPASPAPRPAPEE